MKKFCKDDLAKYNGKENRRGYIALNGKVYDVTNSKLWQQGVHAQIHHAGSDLSPAIKNAPHGIDVLADFPVVGEFVGTSQQNSIKRLFIFLSNKQYHSVTAHFSVSAFVLSPVFIIIYLLFPEWVNLESLSYQLLIIGLVSLPFTISTGLIDWWVKYNMDLTELIKKKMIYSVLLLISAVICFVWRFSLSQILQSYLSVYVGINIILLICNLILGKIGGQLAFPSLVIETWSGKNSTGKAYEIFKLAIIREKESYEFYQKLADKSANMEQKAVIEFLMHQEKKHEVKLQEILDKMET